MREWEPEESLHRRGAVTSSSETPLLVEEKDHLKTRESLDRPYIWWSVPTGPGTKNDCVGEDSRNLVDWTGLEASQPEGAFGG
jgi:hypothetical protein